MSFAGLGFLSFYLAGKLHLFDQRGHTGKAWVSVVPLMGACKIFLPFFAKSLIPGDIALVAISRTMDYRHHWHDVLIGSLLGLSLSWFSYRQYYPPLSHPLSHRPYSPRIGRNRTPLSGIHIHDGDHFYENGNAEELHLSRDSRHTEQLGGIRSHDDLQGTPMDHADTPISLEEVWKRGEGEEIIPPEQASSSLPVPINEAV